MLMEKTHTTSKITPQFFFTTLGVVVALMVSTIGFLNLIFETLEHAFPDVLNASYQYGYSSYTFDGVRTALAIVIIAFPVFFALGRLWRKYIAHGLTHGDEILKKWVLYGLIFLITLTAFIDLIVLVRYFVSGEITIRFVLKVLAVIVVCSLLGSYYIDLLKKGKWNVAKYIPAVAILVVLAGIVYSFSIIGSPTAQRELRLDQRRIEDLQNIQYQVINYWQQKEKLPESMSELVDPLQSWGQIPVDPEFEKGTVYEYRKTADMTFELCATFSRDIPVGWQENQYGGGPYPMYATDSMGGRDVAVSEPAMAPDMIGVTNESWSHGEGRTCFERTIDPERYPIYPKAY